MTTKRLTWIYLTSYLIGGELGLLLIPDIFMSLLLSFTPSILNVRNGSRLCENSEISLSAKNFSHFAFNSSPATVPSRDDMLVLGKY